MTHLGERVTDFVFGELSAAEMDEARKHINGCSECREQVSRLENTRSMLKTLPDVEPPRRVVFEFEKRPVSMWRWLVPVGIAAALLVAVLTAPIHVKYDQSTLTIAFGNPPAPAPVPPPAPAPVAAQPVNYAAVFREILDKEFDKRDAAQVAKIQLWLDRHFYIAAEQRAAERDAYQLMSEAGGN